MTFRQLPSLRSRQPLGSLSQMSLSPDLCSRVGNEKVTVLGQERVWAVVAPGGCEVLVCLAQP